MTQTFQSEGGDGDPASLSYWSMVRTLNTDGQGFGQGAVQYSIPVKTQANADAFLYDLKVADFSDPSGNLQTLAIATGTVPLAVVDTVAQTSRPFAVERSDPATETISRLTQGYALAVGDIAGKRVAVLAGAGTIAGGASTYVLAIVDLTTPTAPVTLALIPIAATARRRRCDWHAGGRRAAA